MPLIHLVIVLIVIGVLLYVINSIMPIDPAIKKIITVVVILAVCLWLLSAFGLLSDLHIGR